MKCMFCSNAMLTLTAGGGRWFTNNHKMLISRRGRGYHTDFKSSSSDGSSSCCNDLDKLFYEISQMHAFFQTLVDLYSYII